MQIINAMLLFLAILLIWSTLNLERSSKLSTPVDQSSQLNDSMEFLRKLKNKSAKEESQTKRINAYQSTVEESLQDNPQTIDRVQSDFIQRSKQSEQQIHGLSTSSQNLAEKLEKIRVSIMESKSQEDIEFNETSSLLREMMIVIGQLETTTKQLETKSIELNNQISEVKSGVVY